MIGRLFLIAAGCVPIVGCGGGATEMVSVPPGAEAGDLSMSPSSYSAAGVDFDGERGVLVVPENRSDSESRFIALPVVRVFATGEEPAEPIFHLAGGPGMTNLGFSKFSGLIENHDIVMVGYRGVDGSVVMDCPEVEKVFKNPPGGFLSEATFEAIAEAHRACGERLAEEGIDTDGYTLTEVVEDLEDARVALGYSKIHLLSQSYGTRLAMIYSWMYPDSIERSAMISVNPPGHFVWSAERIDEQLRYYADLCRQDPECSGRTEDLAESIRKTLEVMPKRWLVFPIERSQVLAGTFIMLYHTGSAAQVFDAWLKAEQGDWSGLAMLSNMIGMMMSGASVWGEAASKAISSDYIYEPGRDYALESNPPGAIIGAPVTLLGWAGSKGWPGNPIAEEYRRVQPSDTRTLLVSGSIDFSTPMETARDELAPHLSEGTQVVLSEFGHTGDVWNLQPEATVHLLKTFFASGDVDSSLYEHRPMNFHVGFGFNAMAKVGVAVVVVAPVLTIVCLWIGVRSVRRRRRGSAGTAEGLREDGGVDGR